MHIGRAVKQPGLIMSWRWEGRCQCVQVGQSGVSHDHSFPEENVAKRNVLSRNRSVVIVFVLLRTAFSYLLEGQQQAWARTIRSKSTIKTQEGSTAVCNRDSSVFPSPRHVYAHYEEAAKPLQADFSQFFIRVI